MAEGSDTAVSATPDSGSLIQKNWGWLLLLGIIFIFLGTIGLGMLFGLTMASVIFFGVLLLLGGGAQFVDAFKCKGWKSIVWHVLMAILYVVAGVAVISDPVLASALITLVLAGTIAGAGVVRVIMAFQHRGSKGWVWVLVSGIISIVLGLVIFAKWPVSGLWVIGLFVAIEMITNGWSYILLALAARSAGKATPTGAAPAQA